MSGKGDPFLDMKGTVTRAQHARIVQSIYAEFNDEIRQMSIVMGRQASDGHRYYKERCVWCGVNYLDHLIESDEGDKPCVGPAEDEWSEDWWPLAEVDAVVNARRGWSPL